MNPVRSDEVYARFRLSVDNGFRNEYSYIDYRKWGVVEVWSGCRIAGPFPARQHPEDCIEVWFNWKLQATFKSYEAAHALVAELLKKAPAPLGALLEYLNINDRLNNTGEIT